MDEGDIIVDCGNSLFTDTIRREKAVSEAGYNFVGMGVSGGEEGALLGPSIMRLMDIMLALPSLLLAVAIVRGCVRLIRGSRHS